MPQPSNATPMAMSAAVLFVPRNASFPEAPPMIMTSPMMMFHLDVLSIGTALRETVKKGLWSGKRDVRDGDDRKCRQLP